MKLKRLFNRICIWFRSLITNCAHIFIVKFEPIPTEEDLPDHRLYRRLVLCAKCGEVIQSSIVKFTNYGALVITENGVIYKRK